MDSSWTERADQNLQRMQRVLQRTGIAQPREMDVPTSLAWAHAARRCAFCRLSEQCEQWLKGAGRAEDYSEFCPNASFFEHAHDLAMT